MLVDKMHNLEEKLSVTLFTRTFHESFGEKFVNLCLVLPKEYLSDSKNKRFASGLKVLVNYQHNM